ncbi:hypothetical protein C2S52_020235 [Perilla frutescens var. hirtella]|nr:hypothetical protein C2S52_020235 [Perilla frutescens var. hirtella]
MEYNKYLFLLLTIIIAAASPTAATANVSAIYAFGDAIFDAGNNNMLPTICRSNHQPYGIDFPGKIASGRFTDGVLPADILISYLGIKTFLPAYLDPALTDDELHTGVSFACSCSGLDELTAMEKLQERGARRFAIIGMPPLGCLPMDVTLNEAKRECVKAHNSEAEAYNVKLQDLIKHLLVDMPRSKLVYVDIYNPIMSMVNNPKQFGLEHTLEGCCGSLELGPLCSIFSHTCPDPSKYLFWDAAHPTQATYKILTKSFEDRLLSTLLS